MSSVSSDIHTGVHKAPRRPSRAMRVFGAAAWWIASVGLFAGVWELCWWFNWLNPMLLPPPHMFLQDLLYQGRFFDRSTRVGTHSDITIILTVISVTLASSARVLVGLAIAFALSLAAGLMIRYSRWFEFFTLPTIRALAPVSPLAWLPLAMLMFGIGNAPAVFMVFIALFFIMTLATVNLVDAVPRAFHDVARNMGATRRQVFLLVVLPAILPGLFVVLRLNLFAAWIAVLIAEAVGVGSGLGLVVMLAKNTFNAQLAFLTMMVIGIVGFGFDLALRTVQKRLLYWV